MDDEAVVDWKGLKEEFGWPYGRAHTKRLEVAGKFPERFYLTETRTAHPLWNRLKVKQTLTPPKTTK
jgi:hypothetical protein